MKIFFKRTPSILILLVLLVSVSCSKSNQGPSGPDTSENPPPPSLTCDGAPDGTEEFRIKYKSKTAADDAGCASETQKRTCSNGTWSAWSGNFAEESCNSVKVVVVCDDTADGEEETRTMYKTETVLVGEWCLFETQTRTCNKGTWGEWSGTFTYEKCTVGEFNSCDGKPNNSIDTRIRYKTSSAEAGATCLLENQVRYCDNGVWTDWSGTYTETSCSVEGFVSCGEFPHTYTNARIRYAKDLVPYGDTCLFQVQQQTCNNGTWSPWSGTYTSETCQVENVANCGEYPHGYINSRRRYAAETVAYNESCTSQTQFSTCDNGSWSAWTGNYQYDTCQVQDAKSCGETPHGNTLSRTRYETSSVPFGSLCKSEVQSNRCVDGTLSGWTGSFSEISCSVADALSCGDVPHGGTEQRLRYRYEQPSHYSLCNSSESQTRTCNNGTWSAWGGTYQYASCSVQPRGTCTQDTQCVTNECQGSRCCVLDGEASPIDSYCCNTRISGVCQQYSPLNGPCDEGNDCTPGLRLECVNNVCLGESGYSTCSTNNDCTGVCVNGTCQDIQQAGGQCDDNADCDGGLPCFTGRCRLTNGSACTDNNQCYVTCLSNVCVEEKSGMGEDCDTYSEPWGNGYITYQDIFDCEDGLGCYVRGCYKRTGAVCDNNSECDGDCECRDATCSTKICVSEACSRCKYTLGEDCGYSGFQNATPHYISDGYDDADNTCGDGVCNGSGGCRNP